MASLTSSARRVLLATAGMGLLANAAAAQEWKSEGKYETKPMEEKYRDPTSLSYDPVNRVLYMPPENLHQYKVTFVNGVAYLNQGKLDTRIKNKKTGEIIPEYALFVVDADGNFYAIMTDWIPWPDPGGAPKVRHSTLPGGKPVAAAGKFQVEEGIIKYINNESGHYEPENWRLARAIQLLVEQGVSMSHLKGKVDYWTRYAKDYPGDYYAALDPRAATKFPNHMAAADDPSQVRKPAVDDADNKPAPGDDAGLLKPDDPTPIPALDVSRRARNQAPSPTGPEEARPVDPPDPSVVQVIRDRIEQTSVEQMDVRFMQEIYRLDPKAAKLVGQIMADPALIGKNEKMGQLRKTMDLQVWKAILKPRGIQVEITNQGKSNGIRSDLDYTLYYLAEEAGVSIKDLIAEHTRAWQTHHQLTPDRLEIKVMNGDEFYPDWRSEALTEADHRAEVKRILGELRADPEKYSVPGANKQQVHNRALRDGWTELLRYDPLLDKPEIAIERQLIRDQGLTRDIALRYRGVHPQYNHMNALGNLIQNKGEFLHHTGDGPQDAIRRAKYFNRVINEGLGNLRFFANDYKQIFDSDLPNRQALELEYLKKTLGLLKDDTGKPLLDDRQLENFREIIDISMRIELDKTGNRKGEKADYTKQRDHYFKQYRIEADARITKQIEGQDVVAEEREKLVVAEQERLFEVDQKRVLAEAVLAGLRQSVARDLTPEGVLRNRVRFDPATQKFVINDQNGAKKVAFERAAEVALFYELVNSLDDHDPAQKFMKHDMKKRALSTAPSIELAEFYGALDQVGKAEIDKLVAGDPEGKVQRKIDDLIGKQQARALELLVERKQALVRQLQGKGVRGDPLSIPPDQVRAHIVNARLTPLNSYQRAQLGSALTALSTRLSGDFKTAFSQNATPLMMASSAVNLTRAYQAGGVEALGYAAQSEAANYMPWYIQTPWMIADITAKVRRGEYGAAAWQGGLWVAMVKFPNLGNGLLVYNITAGTAEIVHAYFVTRIDVDLVEQALRSRPRDENGGPLRDGVRARPNRIPDATRSVYRGSGPGFPLFYGRYRNPHSIASSPIIINGEKYSDGRVPHDDLSDEQLADTAGREFAPLIDSLLTAAALQPGSPEWRKRAWDLKLKFGFDIPFYRRMARVYQEKYKYITYYDNYPSPYNPEYLSECRLDVSDWYVQQPEGYKLELQGDASFWFGDQSDKMQELIARECALVLGRTHELAERAAEAHKANLETFKQAMARGFEAERALLAAKDATTKRIQAEEQKTQREVERKALALAENHKTQLVMTYPFTYATEELWPVFDFDMRMLPSNVKQPLSIELDRVITGIREGAPSGWKPGKNHEEKFKPDANGWVANRPVTADFRFTAHLLDADREAVAQTTLDLPIVLYEPSFSGSITVTVNGGSATGDPTSYTGALVTVGSETGTSGDMGVVRFDRVKAGTHAIKVEPRKGDERHGPGSGSATLSDPLGSKDWKGASDASVTVVLPYIPEPVASANKPAKKTGDPAGGQAADKPVDKGDKAGGGKPPKKDKGAKAGKDDKPDTASGDSSVVEDLVTVPDVMGIADGAQRVAKLGDADLKADHVAAGNAPSKDVELKVAGQNPKAGTRVQRGSTVTISIYQPFVEDSVTVPDVTTIDSAPLRVAKLASAGLKADHVAAGKAPSPELSLKVAGQNPRAGAKAVRDAVVTIAVYQPFVEDSATVPSVLGLDSSAVLTALGQAGLAAAFAPGGDAPAKENEFRAASQSEPPGKKLARGSPVTVGMFQAHHEPAAAMATVPDLSGRDSASAAAALQQAGLVPAFVVPIQRQSPEQWFLVAAQSEPAGKQVPPGTSVAVELALVSDGTDVASDTTAGEPPGYEPPGNGLVPNVVGMTLGEAIDRLAGVNLTVTGVMAGAPPPTAQEALRIYIQNPPAGSPLPADMSATLTQYGSGEETAPEPPPSDPSPPAPPQPTPPASGSSEYVGEFRGTWQRGPVYWNGEPSTIPIPAEPLVVRIAQDQGIWRVTAERTDPHIGTQQIGGPGGTCTMDAGSLRCEETAGSNHYVLTLSVNGNELDGEFNAHGNENRIDADGNPYHLDIRVGAVLKASRSN